MDLSNGAMRDLIKVGDWQTFCRKRHNRRILRGHIERVRCLVRMLGQEAHPKSLIAQVGSLHIGDGAHRRGVDI